MDAKKTVDHSKFCTQCDAECIACAHGQSHMNTVEPFPGYTHDRTHEVDWETHNQKGHHHILWNGSENEMHPCGSHQCNVLALKNMEWRANDAQIQERLDQRAEANRRQVGGSHYGLGAMQHWDVVDLFNLDYFQGNITKYVFRHKEKNGLQDLEKAKHYLEKYIAIERRKQGIVDEPSPDYAALFTGGGVGGTGEAK